MITVEDWLDAANRYPLLTHNEELLQARVVQEWLACTPPAPAALERRGRRANRRMVEANLRLVYAVWKRYGQHLAIDPVDLLQEGVIGLDRAVKKYDPTRGYKFSTFAFWWVRQAISKVGERGPGPIRLKTDSARLLKKLKDGHDLTPSQCVRLRAVMAASRVISLDAPLRNGGEPGATWADILPDPTVGSSSDQLSSLESALRIDDLQMMMDQLPEVTREVMVLTWGLDGGGERSARQVTRMTGISSRRIRELRGVTERDLCKRMSRYHQHPMPVPVVAKIDKFEAVAQLALGLEM